MIGVPMANSRDTVIADLHRQMDAFFGAGKKAEQIAAGVSGEVGGPIKCARTNKLRAERDKLAPDLKQLADSGTSINKAAAALGI